MATDVLRRQIGQRLLANNRAAISFEFKNVRYLTSGEVSTALRPFYFTVHPDLFGKYPNERATNETSLQYLSSYLQSLQQNKFPRPTSLTFYLKPQDNGNGSLRSVKISLSQADIRKTVVSILSSCNLPTNYVDSIPPPRPAPTPPRQDPHVFRSRFTRHYEQEEADIEERLRKAKKLTLLEWLQENSESSRQKLEKLKPIQEEVERLKSSICNETGLSEIRWECGWNISHTRACLLGFHQLVRDHRYLMRVLKGRTLVFGNDTGVSFEGHILLNTSEVRNNWLDFIKNTVEKQDRALTTVPLFEKTLSRVLRDIQVVRRKFQPHTMAKKYESNLIRMTTSLSDYQGRRGYPRDWPQSLSMFELVVETESGPMMVSPTGQFILPCSCPAFLIVNFITENIPTAVNLLSKYQRIKEVEKQLVKDCKAMFGLVSLVKDDSIIPEAMVTACSQLLKHRDAVNGFLQGIDLKIANYYSVMSDGQMCIPWNWKLTEN